MCFQFLTEYASRTSKIRTDSYVRNIRNHCSGFYFPTALSDPLLFSVMKSNYLFNPLYHIDYSIFIVPLLILPYAARCYFDKVEITILQ